MIDRLHILLLGRPGAGKSHFISTFPKPILVWLFDPIGKEEPYLERGAPQDWVKGEFCWYRDVMSRKEPERLLIRVENWAEPNPQKAQAYRRFLARISDIETEILNQGWATIALDTSTYFELAARYYDKYTAHQFNQKGDVVQDERIHYGASTRACEEIILSRLPNILNANTLVAAHIDDQKDETDDGESVTNRKMVALPGKLPNRAAGAFGEVYRIYKPHVDSDVRVLQTNRRDGRFDCKSLKHVPDFCQAHYEAIKEALAK